MGIYHYLYSASDKEYACLYKRLHDGSYEGPIFWIDGVRYRVYGKLLAEFIQRFGYRHPDAKILPEYEAFEDDDGGGGPIKEEFVAIGGDRDWDVRDIRDHPLFGAEFFDRILREGTAMPLPPKRES